MHFSSGAHTRMVLALTNKHCAEPPQEWSWWKVAGFWILKVVNRIGCEVREEWKIISTFWFEVLKEGTGHFLCWGRPIYTGFWSWVCCTGCLRCPIRNVNLANRYKKSQVQSRLGLRYKLGTQEQIDGIFKIGLDEIMEQTQWRGLSPRTLQYSEVRDEKSAKKTEKEPVL